MRAILLVSVLVSGCSATEAAPSAYELRQKKCRDAITAYYDAGYWFLVDDTDGKGLKPLKKPEDVPFFVCSDPPLAYLKPCAGNECERLKRGVPY